MTRSLPLRLAGILRWIGLAVCGALLLVNVAWPVVFWVNPHAPPPQLVLWQCFLPSVFFTIALFLCCRPARGRHCPKCGSDLTGHVGGVCSACGEPTGPAAHRRFHSRRAWIAVSLMLALASTFIPELFSPWSRLSCWDDSIDITSGRYRCEHYLFFTKWDDRIEETPLSKAYRELIGDPPAPVWHVDSTFAPGMHHSPHYRYHGALSSAEQLTEAFDRTPFDREAKRVAVKTFLELLQTGDSILKAVRYASEVASLFLDLPPGTQITVERLPEP